MDKKFYVGVGYYPEHWPEERWDIDAAMMKEAGITIARIAEFGWSLMEPADGVFDFSLFDRAIEVLAKRGIQIILGTPTEIPPQWMWRKYPDMVISNEYGLKDGGRSNFCPNNPVYILYMERFVRKMAEHYKDNPAVVAWQIDNEFHGHLCHCEHCSAVFREWLKDKYGTLEKLNEEWGTVFWSQVYNSWDEVEVPAKRTMITSASQIMDFRRFSSHSRVRFQGRQAKILREVCPLHKITHNGMGQYDRINYYDLGKDLDFYSWDQYPAVDLDPDHLCISNDLSRGIKEKSFWIMEQKNGYFNYAPYNMAIEPGLIRLWSMRSVARGADAVVFYHWRGGRFGREQHPNGILRHDGSPRRAYDEVKQFSNEMKLIGEDLLDSKFEAEIAMIWDYESIWALETQIQNDKLNYKKVFYEYYKAIKKLGVNVDVLNPLADLSRYKVVVVPIMFIMNEQIAENLKKYVQAGGILVITIRTGVKTWANTTTTIPWPGLLHEAAGCTVLEFDSLPVNASNKVIYKDKSYTVNTFLEVLQCNTSEAIGVYEEKFYKGEPAVTLNKYGKGSVIYCGFMGSQELIEAIMKDVFVANNIPMKTLSPGIEVTCRKGKKNTYMFVLNSAFEEREFTLDGIYRNLLDGKIVSGTVILKRFDTMVLVKEK